MKPQHPIRRALLKISGEALMGSGPYGIDARACAALADQIQGALALGTALGVVVGGGNFFRGATASELGMDRAQADYIGMLGTIMNGMALGEILKARGVDARALSALPIDAVAERYARAKAMEHLERGRCPIFVAGTGNPFFTVDTAAVLRAAEVEAEALFVGTRRPLGSERPESRLDAAALALARDRKMPICVFNLGEPGSLASAISGSSGGWARVDPV